MRRLPAIAEGHFDFLPRTAGPLIDGYAFLNGKGEKTMKLPPLCCTVIMGLVLVSAAAARPTSCFPMVP